MQNLYNSASFRTLTAKEIGVVCGGVDWGQVRSGSLAVLSAAGTVAGFAIVGASMPALVAVGVGLVALGGAVLIVDGLLSD